MLLQRLVISNLILVDHAELVFTAGLQVITGESGAGKSAVLRAFSLALGGRAESQVVKSGTERAEVVLECEFNTQTHPAAKWLVAHDLDDDDGRCTLRRTITKEGRSRAYVNNRSVPLNDLRTLGERLVHLHGQHQNLALFRSDYQMELLDRYAENTRLLEAVKAAYGDWSRCVKQYRALKAQEETRENQLALYRYQCEEMNELDPTEGEWERLTAKQKNLSQAESLIQIAQQTAGSLSGADDEAFSNILARAANDIGEVKDSDLRLKTAAELLEQARIYIDEASRELLDFSENFECDPETLQAIDSRIARYFDIARKHKISAEHLYSFWQALTQKMLALEEDHQSLETLAKELSTLVEAYRTAAKRLSEARFSAGPKLAEGITQALRGMSMPKVDITFDFTPHDDIESGRLGMERVNIIASLNPGQPQQSLSKVASGGEMARISLAIQLVSVDTNNAPCMIFDEIDTGLGGETARQVGNCLQALADHTQVICVTHLPQIAALGSRHFLVRKHSERAKTSTNITVLSGEQRVAELARMLSGTDENAQALAHAKALLTPG